MSSVVATFRTSEELKSRVDNLARATKRSPGFYYNLMLEELLEDIELAYMAESREEDLKLGKSKIVSWEEVQKENGL